MLQPFSYFGQRLGELDLITEILQNAFAFAIAAVSLLIVAVSIVAV